MAMNLDQTTDTITPSTGAVNTTVVTVNNGLFVNNRTISTSYSIPSGYSANSVGPITVSSGVTITVPAGSRWVVI